MAEIKDKESILKTTREKLLIPQKRTPIKPSVDFAAQSLHTTGEWHDILSGERKKKTKNTKPYTEVYTNQQGYHLEVKER